MQSCSKENNKKYQIWLNPHGNHMTPIDIAPKYTTQVTTLDCRVASKEKPVTEVSKCPQTPFHTATISVLCKS